MRGFVSVVLGAASLWFTKLVLRVTDFFSPPRVAVKAELIFYFDRKCLINLEVVGENYPLSCNCAFFDFF